MHPTHRELAFCISFTLTLVGALGGAIAAEWDWLLACFSLNAAIAFFGAEVQFPVVSTNPMSPQSTTIRKLFFTGSCVLLMFSALGFAKAYERNLDTEAQPKEPEQTESDALLRRRHDLVLEATLKQAQHYLDLLEEEKATRDAPIQLPLSLPEPPVLPTVVVPPAVEAGRDQADAARRSAALEKARREIEERYRRTFDDLDAVAKAIESVGY